MWVFLAVIACLALATPVWADGALALGCTSEGKIVWGYQFGESSVEAAASKALKHCQAEGSDCILFRAVLHGDGAWVALALPSTAPHCSPWGGYYYSASKETAAKMALAACEKNGGHDCKIWFLEQNRGTTTYYIAPGTGHAPQKDPRCFIPGPAGSGSVGTLTGCW